MRTWAGMLVVGVALAVGGRAVVRKAGLRRG